MQCVALEPSKAARVGERCVAGLSQWLGNLVCWCGADREAWLPDNVTNTKQNQYENSKASEIGFNFDVSNEVRGGEFVRAGGL